MKSRLTVYTLPRIQSFLNLLKYLMAYTPWQMDIQDSIEVTTDGTLGISLEQKSDNKTDATKF